MIPDSIKDFTAAHKATYCEPGLDAEELNGAPCGAGALAGRLLPGLRIQAGSAFSLTVKPARFLASAACQAARDTVTHSRRHTTPQVVSNRTAWHAMTSKQGIESAPAWQLLTVSLWLCKGLVSLLGAAGLGALVWAFGPGGLSFVKAAPLSLSIAALLFFSLLPACAHTKPRKHTTAGCEIWPQKSSDLWPTWQQAQCCVVGWGPCLSSHSSAAQELALAL